MKLFRKSIMFLIVLATSLCFFVLGTNEVKAAPGDSYELVTDVNNLAVEDTIIIVASGSNVALSTNQKTNNRGAKDVVKKENNTIDFVDGIQEIVLETGSKEGTFAFNVGTGYLYAASSSKNYMKTQASIDGNASWTIAITEQGVATIKAQGTNTKNLMKYNSSSNLFSCYGSGQDDVSIYKKTKIDSSLPQLSTPVVSVEEKVASWDAIEGAVKYNVGLYDSVEATTAKYEITTNETSYDFTNVVSVGTWYVKVKAIADNVNATSSEYSSNEATFTNSTSEINCTPTEFLSFVDFNTSVTFVVKGSLESFYQGGYNAEHNNASFYLTDGTSKALCFRVPGAEGAKLQVGDVVTVSGNLNVYNDVNQIGQGGKYVEIIPGAALEFEKLQTKTSLKLTLENDEVSAVAIRFGMMIPVEQYDALVAAGATFGVAVVKKATLASTELSSVVDKYAFACASVVRVNEAGVADAEGAYYQFSFVVNNVPSVSYNEVLVAACYVLINGVYYVAVEATHSVQSVANVYVSADDTSSYTKYLDILNKLAGK